MDIKNLETFPTIEHVHEIVRDLGKGNIEAEKALVEIINRTPEDVAARMLLIDLLIVNRRLEEAAIQLQQTIDYSEAQPWKWELIAVNEHIKQVQQEMLSQGNQLA